MNILLRVRSPECAYVFFLIEIQLCHLLGSHLMVVVFLQGHNQFCHHGETTREAVSIGWWDKECSNLVICRIKP